jgi:hypothetical protein
MFIFFNACNGDASDTSDNLSASETDITSNEVDSGIYGDQYNSEEGLRILDMLVNSELGWRLIDRTETDLFFEKTSENVYTAEWEKRSYSVFYGEDWMTFIEEEELPEGETPLRECFALEFISKDTFKLFAVEMCARLKDDVSDTYVRVKADDGIIALNRSSNSEDIKKVSEKISGRYIEAEYKEGTFRKLCTRYKIYKHKTADKDMHDNLWFDNVMDGYEYHIENVSYNPMEPDKIIFEGTENYFEEKKSTITFMMFNNYKVLTVESSGEKLWYVHEDHYSGLAEPSEPCD